MLLSLKVKNYALIDEMHVEFHHGLNIITGETGAGKSILLGALGLILGKRADMGVLSDTTKKCIVEAEFKIDGYDLEALFSEYDIDFDIHTVFRREILSSGKSRAFINDTPVNLSTLQELALLLVDIHSQHQNLLLNKQPFLLSIIDRFIGHEKLLGSNITAYKRYKNFELSYLKQKEELETIQADIEYLAHQVNELKEADIKNGEISQLEQELSQIDNAGDIKTALHEASQSLSVEDYGVIEVLGSVSGLLDKISKVYPNASELIQRIESSLIDLKEVDSDIVTAFGKLEFDPEKQETIKSRIDLLLGLLQKYRVSSESELISLFEVLNNKLSVGIDGEFKIEKQEAELNKLKGEADAFAQKLSHYRQQSIPDIQNRVGELLKEMGILHGQLKIKRDQQELSASGIDAISFLFSANKNHSLQDVSKIASGGELSRLMLSIKAILSTTIGMPTIILDEIDAGVSGEVADKVGNIIRSMSKGMQVINITHLPQVASKGESHFLVYKDHREELTKTMIKKLTDAERLHEIAKMLSGEELSEAAIENARVLLGK